MRERDCGECNGTPIPARAVVSFTAHHFTRYGFFPSPSSDEESRFETSTGRGEKNDYEAQDPSALRRISATVAEAVIEHGVLTTATTDIFSWMGDSPSWRGLRQSQAQSLISSEGISPGDNLTYFEPKTIREVESKPISIPSNRKMCTRSFRWPCRSEGQNAVSSSSLRVSDNDRPNINTYSWILARSPNPSLGSGTDGLDSNDLSLVREHKFDIKFVLSGTKRIGWGPEYRFTECATHAVHFGGVSRIVDELNRQPLHPNPVQFDVQDIHNRSLMLHRAFSKVSHKSERPKLQMIVNIDMHHYCVSQGNLLYDLPAGEIHVKSTFGIVWNALEILFGDLRPQAGAKMLCEIDDALKRARFLCLLKDNAARTIATKIQSISFPEMTSVLMVGRVQHCERILRHLLVFATEKACAACVSAGEPRLAVLVALAGARNASKELLASQFSDSNAGLWVADATFWRPIVQLVCGDLTGVAKSIDWRIALALVVHYSLSPSASLRDILLEYERLLSLGKVPAPTPTYISSKDLSPLPCTSDRDMLWLLFEMHVHYTSNKISSDFIVDILISILCSECWTANATDAQLSWHIFQVLESFLHYVNGLKSNEEKQSVHAVWKAFHRVSVAYSSQLEARRMWAWGVYVALHTPTMEDESGRCARALIDRHGDELFAPLSTSQFLTSIGAPARWLDDGRAFHLCMEIAALGEAEKNGAWVTQFEWELCNCLLRSAQWNALHEVVVRQLCPRAFWGDIADFQIILTEFLVPLNSHNEFVLFWDNGGLLFLDWIGALGLQSSVQSGDIDLVYPNFPTFGPVSVLERRISDALPVMWECGSPRYCAGDELWAPVEGEVLADAHFLALQSIADNVRIAHDMVVQPNRDSLSRLKKLTFSFSQGCLMRHALRCVERFADMIGLIPFTSNNM